MNAPVGALWLLLPLLFAPGCKSKTQKCMETTDTNYASAVAACADDACKAAAEKDRLGWYEACRELD